MKNNAVTDPNAANRRRQLILIFGGLGIATVLAIIGSYAFDNTQQAIRPQTDKGQLVSIAKPGTVADADAYKATLALEQRQLNERLGKMEVTAAEDRAKLDQADKQAVALRTELELLRRNQPLTPTQPVTASPATGPTGQGKVLPSPTGGAAQPFPSTQLPNGSGTGNEIEVITFGSAKNNADPSVIQSNTVVNPNPQVTTSTSTPAALPSQRTPAKAEVTGPFLPATTFFKGQMLNGVDAPTSGQGQGDSGNPHPVSFRISAIANLPSLNESDLQNCRVLGGAIGDLSSERVMIRTETLACITATKKAIEIPLKGYIVGPDGRAGIRGRLVSKAGQVIGAQILAEFAKGLGNAFKQQGTTQVSSAFGVSESINPSKAGQVALAGGFAGGANALSTYYTNLANKLFPVIEADAGNEVEIVLLQGVQIPHDLFALQTFK
jgi:conjugal transfer pilus assembly protein TraB